MGPDRIKINLGCFLPFPIIFTIAAAWLTIFALEANGIKVGVCTAVAIAVVVFGVFSALWSR